jgi:SAM-dependent methyltransferase
MPDSAITRLRAGLGQLVSRRSGLDRSSPTIPKTMPHPPLGQRARATHYRDDAAILPSAIDEARRVLAQGGPAGGLSVLDVGCGAGRLAYGLVAIDSPVERYEGIDVMAAPVDWCARTISPGHSAYHFRTMDVYNERYNPAGARAAAEASLPFDDASFGVAYAYSVFSHMLTADVRAYLGEFDRVLAVDGVAIITAFVEDDVPDEVVNPPGYQGIAWGGALHCVRFSRHHFEAVASESGMRIVTFEHGRATDGQSRILLRHQPAGTI